MTLLNPCIRAVGPADAKLCFVGEAPGEMEEQTGLPFMGYSGQEFTAMLQETGIERSKCYLTNVLWTRPPGNKFDEFLVPKTALPADYMLPSVEQGKYLHPDLLPELDRLRSELTALRPNLVVALGAKALWALTGDSSIGRSRGTVGETKLIPGQKFISTYHPAGILRNWSWRPIALQDLIKARRESEFPEVRRPVRRIVFDPSFAHARWLLREAHRCPILSCDIETEKKQITSIAFSTSSLIGFTIPIWNKEEPNWSYWPEEEECVIWQDIADLLQSHPKVLFQNGLYDVQYLWRMLVRVPNFTEDTMILHHSLYPEMPKGLEFLGSIYTNEISWKRMRQRHGAADTKREE